MVGSLLILLIILWKTIQNFRITLLLLTISMTSRWRLCLCSIQQPSQPTPNHLNRYFHLSLCIGYTRYQATILSSRRYQFRWKEKLSRHGWRSLCLLWFLRLPIQWKYCIPTLPNHTPCWVNTYSSTNQQGTLYILFILSCGIHINLNTGFILYTRVPFNDIWNQLGTLCQRVLEFPSKFSVVVWSLR